MLVGVWIMAFLFIGFPLKIEKIFALITGLAVVIVAYRMKNSESDMYSKHTESVPFVEHKSEPVLSAPEVETPVAPVEPETSSLNTSSIDQPLTQ